MSDDDTIIPEYDDETQQCFDLEPETELSFDD